MTEPSTATTTLSQDKIEKPQNELHQASLQEEGRESSNITTTKATLKTTEPPNYNERALRF